jgi:hypothetical protein
MQLNSVIPRVLAGVIACVAFAVRCGPRINKVYVHRHPLAEWPGRARLHHGQVAQVS